MYLHQFIEYEFKIKTMIILINTDKNLQENEAKREALKMLIRQEMKPFIPHISRIEVHLTDENGAKSGFDDKRCLMEVRMLGRLPMAVTAHAETEDFAVAAALEILKELFVQSMRKLQYH
jgi:hypothetical protein